MVEIAAKTFGWGGSGAILFQLALIALVSWLLSYIASAAGNGQLAGMIKVVSIFIGISMVAKVAWDAIKVVAGIAGIG